jgi:SAM-dependent methyltransferase
MLANTPGAQEALSPTASAFEDAFQQSDPRTYFRLFRSLDYVLPDLAQPVFRNLIAAVRQHIGRPPRVLDLGCGFGHTSALLRYPIDSERLVRRYDCPHLAKLDGRVLAEFDYSYYRSWPLLTDALFVGFDPCEPAIDFALKAGIFDVAFAADLEREEPTTHGMRLLRDVDLIISTGSVGRISQAIFTKVLDLQKDSRMPWIASFVPRTVDYEPYASDFEAFGLVTEKLEGVTFLERRFHSRAEMEKAVDALIARGIDPAGREAEGMSHAEFYLTRPRNNIDALALTDLVTVTNGAGRAQRDRFFVARPRGTTVN